MAWAVSEHNDTSNNTVAWAVSEHIDTSKNTKAWAVSEHINTSKNTKAWAVSQHIDTGLWHILLGEYIWVYLMRVVYSAVLELFKIA